MLRGRSRMGSSLTVIIKTVISDLCSSKLSRYRDTNSVFDLFRITTNWDNDTPRVDVESERPNIGMFILCTPSSKSYMHEAGFGAPNSEDFPRR